MNKICTSQEQSKKLIELGIDISTADMLWTYDFMTNDINGLNVISEQFKPEENDIPAWSLTALLGLMPIICILSISNGHYRIVSNETNTFFHSNPLDAVFEMVVWLKKNRKI